MMGLLIICHGLAFYAWMLFTKWETEENAAAIEKDGANNSLKQGFHAERTGLRLLVALALAVLCNVMLWHNIGLWALAAGGLLCLFSGYFAYVFNPALSVARGLPANYISKEKSAALFDRTLVAFGWRLLPTLRVLLALGATAYAVAMIIIFCHA